MNNEDQILEDSIFKIGKVISVEGRTVRIKVDKTKNSSHFLYKGELLKNISVGGYIKILKGFTKIIGKVDGEFTSEDPFFAKKEYGSDKEKINRILAVSLLGFFKGELFERGIKELPLVGNECFLLHNTEFNQVHNFIRGNDQPIPLGRLALEKGQEINVGVNSLFASHIGIFGNTGSGKSYTLAKIYHELFKIYKNQNNFCTRAKFLLLDFNGEYISENREIEDNIIVESQYKKVFRLSTRARNGEDKFPVSKDVLEDPIFWIIFLEATEKTQAPFLRRALESSFTRNVLGGTPEEITNKLHSLIFDLIKEAIDKKDKDLGSKIFSEILSDLRMSVNNQTQLNETIDLASRIIGFNGTIGSYYVNGIQDVIGNDRYTDSNIKKHLLVPIRQSIDTLEFDLSDVSSIRLRIALKYYDEIIKGYSNREHISPLIKRLETRIKDLNKVISLEEPLVNQQEPQNIRNLIIISLKDVNIQIRKMLPLLLCRNFYEEKKKASDPNTYLNIIIDEAHNILSNISERESEQWKDYRLETFEEIIKEGRKFGVFLTIASQRPADISPTILSQLHNYFLHRLINNNDIYAVEKTIAYLDKVSFDYLPILPTGTCIFAGLLAQVPIVADISEIPHDNAPRNQTMTLVEKWKD